ncbi:MAG: hypothetical protein ACRC3B_23855, partial [Bacteroidia bacterium]
MKKLIGLLLLTVVPFMQYAQKSENNYSPELARAIKKVALMPDSLVAESVRLLDSLAALESTSEYQLNLADIYFEKSRKERTAGATDKCIQSLTRSFQIYDSLKYERGMTQALLSLGVVHIILQKPALSREYLTNALRVRSNISDTLLAKIYNNL